MWSALQDLHFFFFSVLASDLEVLAAFKTEERFIQPPHFKDTSLDNTGGFRSSGLFNMPNRLQEPQGDQRREVYKGFRLGGLEFTRACPRLRQTFFDSLFRRCQSVCFLPCKWPFSSLLRLWCTSATNRPDGKDLRMPASLSLPSLCVLLSIQPSCQNLLHQSTSQLGGHKQLWLEA